MNKFAKLKAVNRLLLKVAAPVVQVQKPVQDVAAKWRNQIGGATQSDEIPVGNYSQVPGRGAGIGSWRDQNNYNAGYGALSTRAHRFAKTLQGITGLGWLGNILPRKQSYVHQQLAKNAPANIKDQRQRVDVGSWNKAVAAASRRLADQTQKQFKLTDQQTDRLRPSIQVMSNIKRQLAANPNMLIELGLANKGNLQQAVKYYGSRPGLVADALSKGLSAQQKDAQGYVIPADIKARMYSKGQRAGKRAQKRLNQLSQFKRPLQNTTAVV